MKYKNSRIQIILPIVIVFSLIGGMLINSLLFNRTAQNPIGKALNIYPQTNKLDLILNTISMDYVDTVSQSKLIEAAIPAIFKKLDPHSVYMTADQIKKANESLNGSFGGIGVQFMVFQDTVTVVRVIPGGPSEEVGLIAGDRIVEVDSTKIAGKGILNDSIISLLKGPEGTNVNIKVVRKGVKKPLAKSITRGLIPVPSVDISYMITDDIGYIKVNTFGMTTYNEFISGLTKLQEEGMKNVIIDLRDNTGGYMGAAVSMINEFLAKNKLIVYTKGNSRPKYEYKANGEGNFQDIGVAVLINESSASASEILAGAIQDNDRGIILGRRSFGKGLVQEQKMLSDGSAIRLTVSRYYSPTGRCIQKSYEGGNEDYAMDIMKRFEKGEFVSADSIKFADSLKFTTPGGKTVYGGGGIMPDIFVPVDTTNITDFFTKLANKGIIYKFAFDYVDSNRKQLSNLKDYKSIVRYVDQKDVMKKLLAYAKENGVKINYRQLKISRKIIETQLKAYIARDLIDDMGYYPIIREIDSTIKKAVDAFRKKPQKKDK